MIDKLRELLFSLFKKESLIGKLIDKLVTKEIITYLFFGVLTTVVNLLTFYLFSRLFISIGWNGIFNSIIPENTRLYEILSGGTDYLDANFIAWVVAILFSFVTNKIWVFESKSWKPSIAAKEFAGFISARIFSFIVETAIMFVMVTLLSSSKILAKVVVGMIVIVMNYAFSKLLIFRKKKDTEEN